MKAKLLNHVRRFLNAPVFLTATLYKTKTPLAEKVLDEKDAPAREQSAPEQLDMFAGSEINEESRMELEKKLEKERARQETVLALQKKYGKNAVVKGMNLEEGATSISRNGQIGGHKA